MNSIIQFGIAGIALVLALITDKFFKNPYIEKPVFDKRKLLFVILVYIIAFGMVLYWSLLAMNGISSSQLTGSLADILPQVILIAFIFTIQLFAEKVKPKSFGFCLPKKWWVLLPPFIFFFGSSLFNISWAREMKINLLLAGTLLVITEEIIFRGFIQNELERIFGTKYIWIIVGILFGLWHVPTDFWGYQYLQQKSYLFSFGQLAMQIGGGIWAGAIYKKTRSLYPIIFFHWIGNNFHLHLFHTIKTLI